jgi:hypothetical protein
MNSASLSLTLSTPREHQHIQPSCALPSFSNGIRITPQGECRRPFGCNDLSGLVALY